MVVELVAGRLIARHVGSSLYTWTSVIGIVLAGIAAGNYVGGRLADRYRAREALASLFLLASAACLLIPLFNDRIGTSQFLRSQDWALRIALHVFFVFFLPSAMMGTISPVAAKMALGDEPPDRPHRRQHLFLGRGGQHRRNLSHRLLSDRAHGHGGGAAVRGRGAAGDGAVSSGPRALAPYIWSGVVLACIFVSVGPWAWTQTVRLRLGLRERTGDTIHFQEESHYSFIRIEDEPDDGRRYAVADDGLFDPRLHRPGEPRPPAVRLRAGLRRPHRTRCARLAAGAQAAGAVAGRRWVCFPALDVAPLARSLCRSRRTRPRRDRAPRTKLSASRCRRRCISSISTPAITSTIC